MKRAALLLAAASLPLLALSTGCDTAAYCFDKCEDGASTETNSGPGGGEGASDSTGISVTGVGGNVDVTIAVSSSGSGPCEPTNPVEICNGIDDDCNGETDEGFDFADPKQCGNCATNCYVLLLNTDPATITCDASGGSPGIDPGTCDGQCATDYFDLDGDGSCETYCIVSADDDALCNNKDDDCDGSVDEDVDKCTDPDNCGICGRQCNASNATTTCVSEAEDGEACDDTNTVCGIDDCADGFFDANGLYSDGCEYPCTLTNGGVEICGDGIDNDCDGFADGNDDDLSGDPFVGEDCFGGQQPGGNPPQGVCGAAGNEGSWGCVGVTYVCEGPNVVEPGDLTEMCNGDDDDCNGLDDDDPADVGSSCGVSNVAPCRFGQNQCVGGALDCVGDIAPGIELCNGIDDDCGGDGDLTNGMQPADAIGPCNVPPDPPAGSTSACMAGMLACTGGVVDCQGDVTAPPGTPDTCGVDQNCDGNLINQPDTDTDVRNCGSCGNDCYGGAVDPTEIYACVAGDCEFQGCAQGWVDTDGDEICDLMCTPTGPEVCDNLDNDCDEMVDEGVAEPPPTQICGVSPSATRPECTSGVDVSCTNGVFVCTFPNGVCSGGCSANDEICDTLDNDCDGLLNENTPNFGKACASDAGDPPPGDGACRTFGTFVCQGPGAVTCNAVPADCDDLPGGCTELCDGVDNDCDGSVDEVLADPGDDPAFYYRPEVVRINTSPNAWMMAYEASRPNATDSTPGSGNGFVTSAPPGETLDATPACSEPDKIPWFNVTPQEVQQTCQMMGGDICDYTTEWRRGCRVQPRTPDCTWGYNPSTTAACITSDTAAKYCNIAPAFDFDGNGANGDQDGLLPTAELTNRDCYADWNGLPGNPATDDAIFDVTGNLREIVIDTVPNPDVFRVVGGAFNTQSEDGATCDFDFYTVANDFKFFDTGFRCCFDADPDP